MNIKNIKDLKTISKAIWEEVRKQAKPDGVHIQPVIYPDGNLVIDADIEINNKRYAKCIEFPKNYKDFSSTELKKVIKNLVKELRNICLETKKLLTKS